ncbi:uncharacterized protein LOC115742795 isoform X2 [Rhodamnia argentea]|uniref:Uncharacterized protein LOC115742795 isoform X2 n=1 Tax=Rhodamnia argentea TaxID=178133 RepID=A0ABM3GSC0_9MYRT|nr:uncharacterized protein LOC115742795 isoform X2 [Rhodamnia argentea]
MYRSSSWSRVSDDDYMHAPPMASTILRMGSFQGNELPAYDAASEMMRKEKTRNKLAENAVHIIPLVLLVCAAILWFFSNPVDVGSRGDSIAARIEGLTIEGDIDTEVDGTQSGLLPFLDLGDADSSRSASTSRHPQDRVHHQDKHSRKPHH